MGHDGKDALFRPLPVDGLIEINRIRDGGTPPTPAQIQMETERNDPDMSSLRRTMKMETFRIGSTNRNMQA